MFSYVRQMRGEFFWTFFIRDVKNGSSTSVIFIITFIYMMRNTAVFFLCSLCTDIGSANRLSHRSQILNDHPNEKVPI